MNTFVKTADSLRVGTLLLLLPPPLFWAGNFIVGRAMHDDVPPMTLALWRWVIALVFILPFAFRHMRRDLPKYWKFRWRVLGASLSGVVSFNSFVYLGLQLTTASNGLLLNSFIPILIVLIAAIFFRQRLHLAQIAGLTVSFAGVLTIVTQGNWSNLASMSFSRGDLFIFCAMVSWALYTLWIRGFPADIDRIGLMGTQILLAIPVLVLLYLFERASGATPTWNIHSIAALTYLGIFPSVVAYLLYNLGVARVGATRAGLSIHLIPLFGMFLAVIFLHEVVHSYQVLGMVAIVAGLVCAGRKQGDVSRPGRLPTSPLTPS
jgi:drug/metabolite transporter (DMT)-like permease